MAATNAPSRSGLVSTPVGVLLGNEAGSVVLVAPSGAIAWTASLGREVAVRPAVTDALVVAASIAGEWVGLSLADGSERWRVADRPAPAAALLAEGTRVFTLGTDGVVQSIDAASGSVQWARPGFGAAEKRTRPAGAPAVALCHSTLVVAGGKSVAALDPGDGSLHWKQELAPLVGTQCAGRRVLALTATGTLYGLERKTGLLSWTRELGGEASAGPSRAAGALWVGLEDGSLLQLAEEDGHELWRTRLPAPLRSGVAEARGLVLVPTSGPEGKLVGIRPGESSPAFEVRVDSPLRSAPVMISELVVFAASDGRVFGYRLRAPR